jgi:putative ABC transport system ATP-binding protein
MNQVAIQVNNVTKIFGNAPTEFKALSDVSLLLPTGELILIEGPSGCGKTTLLSIIAGILSPTSGEVTVLGQQWTGRSDAERARFRRNHLGFIFQQYHLLPALTAEENVAVPLLAQGLDRTKALKRAFHLLERIDMRLHAAKLPKQLSGGQQQRVAIARALVHEPGLVIADEPTAALDSNTGRQVMDLIKTVAVQSGRAVIVVTHDSRIHSYANRIISMEDGRINRITAVRAEK